MQMTLFTPVSIKSGIADKAHLRVGLEKNLQSVIDWGRRWLVNFNASKTKVLSFTHHKESSLPPISMADAQLHDSISLYLFGLTFFTELR